MSPRLSLCIPTYNRARFLEEALASGLREADLQAPGTVEVLVCDNASTDGTAQLLERMSAAHPALRVIRHPENRGFDRNYLSCLQQALGEFVWVMGDDDVWQPGAVARVLRELDAGADACLCLAEACDLDLKPVTVLPWLLGANPPTVWRIAGREDLLRYFNACAFNAAVFAFISVAIVRRDRFPLDPQALEGGFDFGYLQVWGMLQFLRQPTQLHYIPEVLVRNRISGMHADNFSYGNLFNSWMHDLRWWAYLADRQLGDDPELRDAFCRILGRNHHNTILPGLRQHAPSEAAWREAVPLLQRAGFSPVRIAAVDLAFQHMYGGRLPMPSLEPAGLCLADLPLVARGARRIAVLALGGLGDIYAGAGLLAALRALGGAELIRILTVPEGAVLLDGFEVRPVDPRRYAADEVYREAVAQELAGFAPELMVNLDPERGVQGDDLVNAALPAGALAFELPMRGQDERTVKFANGAYTRLVPRGAAMFEALGLAPAAPALWPAQAARQEAGELLALQGWDPGRTLAVLVDDPAGLEDPAFQAALAEADADGWTFVGLSGQSSTYRKLEAVLGPRGERAANLAGVLDLGSMAALLQLCGGFVGGTRLLGSMATACGCTPFLR